MHYKKAVLVFSGLAFCIAGKSFAQSVKKDSASSGVLVDMSYMAQFPAGNMVQRFGYSNDIQLAAYYKFSNDWMVGLQGSTIFGNRIKANVLDSIATSDGGIIANDGNYTNVNYFERGYDIQVTVGKLIPLHKKNLNSGVLLMMSSGYLRHHIRIETPSDWVPQVSGSYEEGYERITAGVCVTEFAGYQYISKNRIINFFAGLEFTQGYTKSLEYDFDLMEKNTTLRYDLLNGVRVGWILPILRKPTNNVFYTH